MMCHLMNAAFTANPILNKIKESNIKRKSLDLARGLKNL